MTAQIESGAALDDLDTLLTDPLTAFDAAHRHIAERALIESVVGKVGLELEYHLVDLTHPQRRPTWAQVQRAATELPLMPAGSAVTLEPGGQIELSTLPAPDLVRAVAALRADNAALRAALLRLGLGTAPLGTDPARPPQRINPHTRYVAMEEHFGALGCADAGRSMMAATAALQLNLEAGPRAGWADRMALAAALGPVLIAVSATSPLLGGESSGWHSMRQGIWHGVDHGRSDPVTGADPAAAWAAYALDAPVMLVRDGDTSRPVTSRIPFADWLRGRGPVARAPRGDDLAYHLTTLFPPVRPRGWIELRCLDAMPHRWWPAVAALATVLMDDPDAADRARAVTEPVADARLSAARDGLADPQLRTAALECVRIAVERAPQELHDELDAFGELLDSGRTPSDLVRDRAHEVGPLRLLEEEARA